MTKFKVGDRVRLINNGYIDSIDVKEIPVESTATVEGVVGRWLVVVWDNAECPDGGYRIERFDLIPERTESFIVVSKDKFGKLLTAARPFVHFAREEAEKEALRLAELPTVTGEFVVFKAVSAAVVPAKPAATLKNL